MPADPSETSFRPVGAGHRLSDVEPRVPDHEMLRCIGSGSYGEVWLARNVMGTYRAIKVVYRSTFTDDHPYERELRGMQHFEPVSRSHDGLVDLLQIGKNTAAGYHYYVMELADDVVSGQAIDPASYVPRTLAEDAVRRGRLPFEECLQVGLGLSAALAHLHQNGLIHRDIKPANIIFVNGIPKIADIGLVAEVGTPQSFVGTAGFIPPEGPGTAQADLYSLGKVLYEISTGRDRQLFPELPTQLDTPAGQEGFLELNEVVLRACETDPRRRYRSAEELHSDLLLLQAGKSVKRLRLLEQRIALLTRIGIGALAALILVGGVGYQINRERRFAAERIQQQVARNVALGNRLVEEGDLFGALPPLVQALSLDAGNPRAARSHRVRIAAVLRQCPRVADLWSLNTELNGGTLSPDGRFLVVCGPGESKHGTSIVCRLDSRTLDTLPRTSSNEIEGVFFSRDGRHLILTGEHYAELWDFASRIELGSVRPPGVVYGADLSPDGALLATASGGNTEGHVWLWDVATRQVRIRLAASTNAFRSVSFSADGRRLVTACEDGLARVWDLASRAPIGEPIRHQSWVYHASFSPDGQKVATAGYDGWVQVCSSETGRLLLPPLKHRAAVKQTRFSPDGRFLVTACWDFTARVWELAGGETVPPALRHSGKHLVSAAFHPDGRRIVTVNANGVISLWDPAPVGRLPVMTRSRLSADGERLASLAGRQVSVTAVRTGALLSRIEVAEPVVGFQLDEHGDRLLTLGQELGPGGATNFFAQVWDAARGAAVTPNLPLGGSLPTVELSPGGQLLGVVRPADPAVRIHAAAGGALLHTLVHPGPVGGVAFSRDRQWISAWSGTNVLLWNARTGAPGHRLSHAHDVGYTEFSPDSRLLVTCTQDDTLFERDARVWDVSTGRQVGRALEHGDGVERASFSPDGRRVATASEDTTACIWPVPPRTPLPLQTLPHAAQVTDVRFSRDGSWLVTACNDGVLRVWDSETGEAVTPPLKNPWLGRSAQFAADASAVLQRNTTDGSSLLRELPEAPYPVEDLTQLAELLSRQRPHVSAATSSSRANPLAESWEQLSRTFPAFFEVGRDEILAWHRQQAETCERATNWIAAAFHWDRLAQLDPADPVFREREAAARKAAQP